MFGDARPGGAQRVARGVEAWAAESIEHGWPSFRAEEVVHANIVVDPNDGEVRSVCGLHLGHNIPDHAGDRYCIDLVCIAGVEGRGTEFAPTTKAAGDGVDGGGGGGEL